SVRSVTSPTETFTVSLHDALPILEDLVAVGVADAGDDRLVTQQALDLHASCQQRTQLEARGQWIGAEARDARDLLRIAHRVHRQTLAGSGLGEVEALVGAVPAIDSEPQRDRSAHPDP